MGCGQHENDADVAAANSNALRTMHFTMLWWSGAGWAGPMGSVLLVEQKT